MKPQQDFLFYNLPAVFYKNSYLIYSPYAKLVARVPLSKFNDRLKYQLYKNDFFSSKLWEKSKDEVLITLMVTTDCNFRCKYCYIRAGEKPEYMDPKIAEGIVKSILKNNPKKIMVHFFGGEPTLNMSTIKRVIKFIKKKKVKHQFNITTNGAISNENLDYLIKNNFVFTISMDSIPKINDKERVFVDGSGSSQIVEKTIKRLVNSKVKMSIRATITKSNLNYLLEAIKYWASLGIKYIHFELINPTGRGEKLPIVNINKYINCVKKALDISEKEKIFIISSAYMNLLTPSNYFCMSCKGERPIFLPNGTLSLCYEVQKPNSFYKNFIIGRYDTKKQNLNIDIHKSKSMRKINVNSFKKCRNCFAKYICSGGCPKRNLEATKSFFEPNPMDCKIKKELIRDAIIRTYKANRKNKISCVFGTSIFENF